MSRSTASVKAGCWGARRQGLATARGQPLLIKLKGKVEPFYR